MHRAIASYANGAPAGALDDTTVLEQYGAMVERMARRLISRTGLRSAYDDLWSAGAIGLIEAGRRFDVSRGASFATFAEHRVRGAMLDELRRLDHLPRRLRNRTDDLVKTRKRLAGNLGREATVEEVATELGVDVEEASDMAALLEPPLPLESILPTLAGVESHRRGCAARRGRAPLDRGAGEAARTPAHGAVIALHRGSHLSRNRRHAGGERAARVPIAQ